MDFKFYGYIEMAGEEFNLPGTITSPLFGENCLYPIWIDTSDETLYWLSVKEGELYVCEAYNTEYDWSLDSDASFWVQSNGELVNSELYETMPEIGLIARVFEAWNEVVVRSELGEKMST